jgi:hypothetical protein
VTGTNGKTTTTTMLAAILTAADRRTAALGNIGEPLVHAALDPGRFDVLAVELSSFQLHWSSTMAPPLGALLNLADDHLEWHGTFSAYAEAKREIWRAAAAGAGIAVGNLDDPLVARMLAAVPGRRVGVTLAEPGRASSASSTARWSTARSPRRRAGRSGAGGRGPPAGRHNVSNALHAAALARGHGVSPARSATGWPATPRSRTATPWWRRWRRGVRRRQQGDQPARRQRLPDGVPAHRLGRRRSAQGRGRRRHWWHRWPTGWSGRCCSGSTGPRSPPRSRDTPRRSPWWTWRGR